MAVGPAVAFCWISCIGDKRIESVLESLWEKGVTCTLLQLQVVSYPKTAALWGRCDKPYVYGALWECCTIFRWLSVERHSYKFSPLFTGCVTGTKTPKLPQNTQIAPKHPNCPKKPKLPQNTLLLVYIFSLSAIRVLLSILWADLLAVWESNL